MTMSYKQEDVEDLFHQLEHEVLRNYAVDTGNAPGAWVSAVEIDRLNVTCKLLFLKLSHYERIAR
jgi:hypothetical protein